MIERITRQAVQMPVSYKHNTGSVPIDYYLSEVKGSDKKPLLVLPGMGEDHYVSRKLAYNLKVLGIPALIAVLKFPDIGSMDVVCKKAPGFMAALLNKTYGDNPQAAVSTLSHSQSGGAVLVAGNNTEQFAGAKHAVVSPVGVNTLAMGQDMSARKKEFWKRLLWKNNLQPGQFVPANWRAGLDLSLRLVGDTVGSWAANDYSLLGHKVEYALSDQMHDLAMRGLARLQENSSVIMYTGKDDPLFPWGELRMATHNYEPTRAVSVLIESGAHESMVNSNGKHQLQNPIRFLTGVDTSVSQLS